MVDRIHDLITRFPEDERTARELIRKDRSFNALCDEYAQIGKELHTLARLNDVAAAAQKDGLRRRRMVVEEELVTLMEGYRSL